MAKESSKNILDTIQYPEDLRRLRLNQLPQLCDELRQFVINELSQNPGHFGSTLGVIELTVALHYVYNTPNDRLVWDVGHQAYAHKILTGRRGQFHTNRKFKGLKPFPSPEESEYDTFTCGHASNSISAALGMAVAAKKLGEDRRRVVAIIGDGAMSGGLAFEGLNNVSESDNDMLIVLNDNKMSISKNVGAMAKYLSEVRTRSSYINTKRSVKIKLNKVPLIGRPLSRLIEKTKQALKNVVLKQNMFEALGFYYLGPVDGHDIYKMIDVLKSAKEINNMPIVVHAVTTKGKGYDFAETSPESYHGVSTFNYEEGVQTLSYGYSEAFGDAICEIAEKMIKFAQLLRQ